MPLPAREPQLAAALQWCCWRLSVFGPTAALIVSVAVAGLRAAAGSRSLGSSAICCAIVLVVIFSVIVGAWQMLQFFQS